MNISSREISLVLTIFFGTLRCEGICCEGRIEKRIFLAKVRLYFVCITIILRAEFNKGMHPCKHH
jgi:hypothetical protein